MRRSYQYSVNKKKGAVILSLAYEMTPNFAPPVDVTGMSKLPTTSKQFPSEAESALKLVGSVGHIKDVDKGLHQTQAESNFTGRSCKILWHLPDLTEPSTLNG